MIATIALVVAMYAVLTVIGYGALAPLEDRVRELLAPAAPVFGAALVAAVSSTTSRWLTMRGSLVVVAVILLGLLVVAVRTGRRPGRLGRRSVAALLLCPVLTCAGAAAVSLPSWWVGDHAPVDATLVVDQYYFAATSTYLIDHPMLPAPRWTSADPVGSAPPSQGPVVDVIGHRLRYGQACVAAGLAIVLGREPAELVSPLSILLLVLVGPAAFLAAVLLGARSWAFAAVPLTTGALLVTSQALEGKNDGLLGISLALVALALSLTVQRTAAVRWPLVLVAAGLAATYSELVLVLLAPVALTALLGPRTGWFSRVNAVAGCWAAAALLTPFAWIWLAQSARIGGRFSSGATPFEHHRSAGLLRALAGLDPDPRGPLLPAVLGVLAACCLVALVAGLGWAVLATPARGAALGVVLTLTVLEVAALHSDAGNLQYRTAQIGCPLLLVLAVVGGSSLVREHPVRWRRIPLAGVAVAVVVLSLTVGNVATAALYLPRARAEEQHVPMQQLHDAAGWIREVGAEDVAVVVPRFTDLIWLALDLREDAVTYPVIPAIYLGDFARWDRRRERYYLVGAGATVTGGARVLHRNDRFALVELGASGMVLAPYQPTFSWARLTFMRGFPCARDGSALMLVHGPRAPREFSVTARGTVRTRAVLDVRTEDGDLRSAGRSRVGPWVTQRFVTPRRPVSVLSLDLTPGLVSHGTTAVPVVLGPASPRRMAALDPGLVDFCLADEHDGMDGYDRDLTTLRRG